MPDVRRPGAATDANGQDLVAPTTAFLSAVGLMPDPDKPEKTEGSRSAEDNALEVTKKAKSFTELATGAGGGVSFIGAVIAATQGKSDLVVAALAIATAIIVAAGIYGVARVTDGDVRGRSAVATAAMEARAEVARSLLMSYDAVAKATTSERKSTDGDKSGEKTGATGVEKGLDLQLLLAVFGLGVGARAATTKGQDVIKGLRWSKEDGLEVQLTAQEDFVSYTRLQEISRTA